MQAMRQLRTTVFAAAVTMTAMSCVSVATGDISDERRPRKEDTYTITSVIQVLRPVNPADMNDDFQDARVLAGQGLIHRGGHLLSALSPGRRRGPRLAQDDAGMTEYLRPTPTENWDENDAAGPRRGTSSRRH